MILWRSERDVVFMPATGAAFVPDCSVRARSTRRPTWDGSVPTGLAHSLLHSSCEPLQRGSCDTCKQRATERSQQRSRLRSFHVSDGLDQETGTALLPNRKDDGCRRQRSTNHCCADYRHASARPRALQRLLSRSTHYRELTIDSQVCRFCFTSGALDGVWLTFWDFVIHVGSSLLDLLDGRSFRGSLGSGGYPVRRFSVWSER